MLGPKQRETLNWYFDKLSSGQEPQILLILVHPFRYFTREAGGGSGHPISIRMVYLSDGEHDLAQWVSTCHDFDTAVEKGREIGRYLCDELGLSREQVKLRCR